MRSRRSVMLGLVAVALIAGFGVGLAAEIASWSTFVLYAVGAGAIAAVVGVGVPVALAVQAAHKETQPDDVPKLWRVHKPQTQLHVESGQSGETEDQKRHWGRPHWGKQVD